MGCLLVKLGLGLSNPVLSTLFSLPDKKFANRILTGARTVIMAHFAPKHLGYERTSTQDSITKYTRSLAKRPFTSSGDDVAILVLDRTYIYVQKSANNIVQRRTFVLQKDRRLIKLMMIVAIDGYIISAMGPYVADDWNNGASMTKQIMMNNPEGVTDWLKPNDVLIVDRGFRDCLPLLNRFGCKTHILAFLSKIEKQFTANEVNQTRLNYRDILGSRSAHGRIKIWHCFDRVLPNSMILIAGDLFSIVCALVNGYRPLFAPNVSNDDMIADKMLSLVGESNKLKESIDKLIPDNTKGLNWRRIDASNTIRDLPILTVDQLNEITLGWFKMKQAKRQAMEYLLANGSFTVRLVKR